MQHNPGIVSGGLDVDVVTSAIPTGAATSANQATEIASLATVAGAVAGTEMQVDVLTLPAITGTVTANAGTNLNTSALALDSTVAKDSSLSTINTSVNTLLKPANTLAAVTTVSTVTNLAQQGGVAISLNTGVRDTGTQRVTIATNDVVPASQSGTWTVQPGNTPNTTPWLAQAPNNTRADTYTVTGNGTTVSVLTTPVQAFGIQIKGTTAPATTWDVRLEGSLDGTNFSQIIAHTNTDGDGAVKWTGTTLSPSLYYRSRCSGLVLGAASNIVVTILGVA